MRILFRVLNIVTGVLLVLSTTFQLLAMLGGVLLNEHNNLTDQLPWLVPTWCATLVLLIVAFILVVKRGKDYRWQMWLLIGGLVGAVATFVVAITLRDALPEQLIVSGEVQGLTTWKLLYRHMSSVLVGLLIALIAGLQRAISRAEGRRAASTFDPTASTIGLDSFGGDDSAYQKPKRLKRSLRRSKQKADAQQAENSHSAE